MTRAYVVVEGSFDVGLLKRVLPPLLIDDVEFVDGKGNYGAKSSAVTLLALKHLPLVLVLDSDNEPVDDERSFAESLLGRAGSNDLFRVLIANPELETLFFQSPELLQRVFDRQFTDLELELGKQAPRTFLLKAANATDKKQYNEIRQRLFDALQDDDVERIRQHELISGLIDFLTEVTNRETAN